MTGLTIGDVVANKNGDRLRVVMVNYPLVYCVTQHAPKTDAGSYVYYCDEVIALGYKIEGK